MSRGAKGASSAPRGAVRKPYVRLTDEQIKDIWLARLGSKSCASVAREFGVSDKRVSQIQTHGRRCEGGCQRITTSESGRCNACADRRRPSSLTESEREQITRLRERGLTYADISNRLGVSVAKVRKVLDPGFQGKRTIRDGIVRTEHRNGAVTFSALVHVPGSRKQRNLGPFPTHEAADEGRRTWKAQNLGVRTPTSRRGQPDLTDVYASVRLAIRNLTAVEQIPEIQARAIFSALYAAEDKIQDALRDEYSGRFRHLAA